MYKHMEPNNFLNRKRVNLNLVNRSPYKATSSKSTLVHPFLVYPLKHVPSSYAPDTEANLGFYIPIDAFEHDGQLKYALHEHNLVVDSSDRDPATYRNPLRFTVRLNPLPSDPAPTISHPKVRYIKYVQVVNVMLPRHYHLRRTEKPVDEDLLAFISDNIASWRPGVEATFQGSNKLQICNVVWRGPTSWEVNLTWNRDPNAIVSLMRGEDGVVRQFEYTPYDNLMSDEPAVFLSVRQLENRTMYNTDNTASNAMVLPLYPKKIYGASMNLDLKKGIIVYKNSQLAELERLEVAFLDRQGVPLEVPLLDTEASKNYSSCNCKENVDYSCKCYYLRHPYHPWWQCHLVMKLGVVEGFF
jgi:hypothetical protein